jgi:hypothetical protein
MKPVAKKISIVRAAAVSNMPIIRHMTAEVLLGLKVPLILNLLFPEKAGAINLPPPNQSINFLQDYLA